ncbi:hypothetical protein NMG60_11025021 [Bertholletia excelsa]
MAVQATVKQRLLAFSVIYFFLSGCNLGKADEAHEDLAQTGAGIEDPAQIVSQALLCFNDKYIYSSCEETCRLSQSGNLNVPHEHTDEFCNGPCLAETYLVLHCIENILAHFEFHNKATVQDVRQTIEAGCGHGSQRGNFNVAEHLQAEKSRGKRLSTVPIMVGLVWLILVHGLLD